MADFPNHVYLRKPIEDGELVLGGGLDAAIDRLQEIRNEIVAAETALGTLVKGSAASLVERLSHRLSRNGIPRGQLYFSTAGLWQDGTLWLQAGVNTVGVGQSVFQFQAWAKNYITADLPPLVVTSAKANSTPNPSAWAVVGGILATGFFVSLQQRARGYTGSSTLVDAITYNWLAIGGTPT